MSMPRSEYLITTREAAELLGLTTRSTVSRWVQLGKITPALRVPGGRHGAFLFHRADVEALAADLARSA